MYAEKIIHIFIVGNPHFYSILDYWFLDQRIRSK